VAAAKILFWVCLFIIAYSYIGYGILLFLLTRIKGMFRKRKGPDTVGSFEPEVTLIVAAFNEEDYIEEKIRNTFELDYPSHLLKIIFITDGSTDNTPVIAGGFLGIQVLHEPQRRGKVAAMNRAMKYVNTPYVISSDANTLLNPACVKEMVKHYQDPSVGGVAGEKKLISTEADGAAAVGEGLYWKYESFLKKMDSELYSVVGAAGELFSFRSDLFASTREDMIIEDFVQSLEICLKGYVIRYEPKAFAMEDSSLSMKEEEKRKVRICAGAFQAMVHLRRLFNIFKYPVLSFQFISHRVLRWTLCPLSVGILFVSNAILLFEPGLFYPLFFALQLSFYLLAVAGWSLAHKNIRIKSLYLPYYFLFMNMSVFMGFVRFLRKNQTILWEKASRRKPA
jgi:cellulose synthase/poly-beta-1,6-N-acetylglucosamine synthase-like glycosyltransferase